MIKVFYLDDGLFTAIFYDLGLHYKGAMKGQRLA